MKRSNTVRTTYRDITQKDAKSFSAWVTPLTGGDYKLACCDCGLVHNIEFRVISKGGKPLDLRTVQVKFRVRRNIRATAAMRSSCLVTTHL